MNTGFLNDHAKEEVKSRADIAAVIGRYVNLKASGQTLKGLCPFHKEKTPSFHVNPGRGFFHCFGCGKGGDIFTFLQEIEGISFVDALKMLADETGVKLDLQSVREQAPTGIGEVVSAAAVSKADLRKIHDVATLFFYSRIKPNPAAVDYFKSRGLSPQIVKEFRLGYAPDRWDALISHCAGVGIGSDTLVAAGLAVAKERGGAYDRFRNRIIFPLSDISGRVIAFAGRAMNDQDMPKYLNSPETPLYHKNRFLYGLDKARVPVRESKRILVVEGYMDYLSLYQAGIRNVVATSGTALTEEHGRIISRFTSKVVLTFDGDAAGRNAAQRGIFVLAPFNLDISVLVLPGEEDPDSFVKKYGAAAFNDQLEKNIKNSSDFLIEKLVADNEGTTPRGKIIVLDQCAPLVRSMGNPIMRTEFRRLLADRLGVDPRLVLERMPDPGPGADREREQPAKLDFFANSLEGSFLKILLSKPELIAMAREYISPETLTDPFSANIYSILITTFDETGKVETILDRTDDPESKRIISSMLVKPALQEHMQEELVQKIIHLRAKYVKARIRTINSRFGVEPRKRTELLRELKDLSDQLRDLEE